MNMLSFKISSSRYTESKTLKIEKIYCNFYIFTFEIIKMVDTIRDNLSRYVRSMESKLILS